MAKKTDVHDLKLVKLITRELAYKVVYSDVKSGKLSRKYAMTLIRTVDEVITRNERVFSGMVARLGISESSIKTVLGEIMSKDMMNWGRMVTMYAVGRCFAQHANNMHRLELVDQISKWLGDYMAEHLAAWIDSAGGWDAFYYCFAERVESRLWWHGFLAVCVCVLMIVIR